MLRMSPIIKAPISTSRLPLKTIPTDCPLCLNSLNESGCSKIILTGSVFENDEGVGSEPGRHFRLMAYRRASLGSCFAIIRSSPDEPGKFVIANPFGPYEEPRFTHYLMKNWFAGTIPVVNTPSYVRDNIHASLLAKVMFSLSTLPMVSVASIPAAMSRQQARSFIGWPVK